MSDTKRKLVKADIGPIKLDKVGATAEGFLEDPAHWTPWTGEGGKVTKCPVIRTEDGFKRTVYCGANAVQQLVALPPGTFVRITRTKGEIPMKGSKRKMVVYEVAYDPDSLEHARQSAEVPF